MSEIQSKDNLQNSGGRRKSIIHGGRRKSIIHGGRRKSILLGGAINSSQVDKDDGFGSASNIKETEGEMDNEVIMDLFDGKDKDEEQLTDRMTKRENRNLMILYPEDTFLINWQIFITILLLVACIYTPWEIAFSTDAKIFSRSIDLLFLIDIIITFNVAYFDDGYNIVEKRGPIASNYLKGWFVIDFTSIIPFDLILSA
jgi:hypothetical protein